MIQIKKCYNSFGYAFKGIAYCLKNENNFKVHTLAAIVVVLLGTWVKLSRVEWCILFLTIGFVMACELFNTATEKLTDLVAPNFHPKAGAVKDLAAGAVLVASGIAVVIGIVLFLPYLVV